METNIIYTSTEKPKMVIEKVNRTTLRYIPYDIVENNGTYSYKYVLLDPTRYNYEGLIDTLIGTKYELKTTIAILSNYLLDPTNLEYKKEFDDFQQWRKFAKNEAKKYFKK